uniref:Steroid 5-alpha-reductase DET2 n=1 Tax=Davidia involucrata TaxID=16924 RepID=A0A5B7APS6_DAVIN
MVFHFNLEPRWLMLEGEYQNPPLIIFSKSQLLLFYKYTSIHKCFTLESITHQVHNYTLTQRPKQNMASDQYLFHYSLLTLFLIGPPTFISLRFLQAPYGKHHRSGWGPTISPPLAWFLMEGPTLWLTFLIFPFGQHHSNPKALTLISPFLIHYLNRTCLYPLRMHLKTNRKTGFPVSVALMAFTFNLLNSYLQARWVSHYADYGTDKWFWWRFFGGLAVFIGGMTVNIRSDTALLALKGEGGGYRIPRGGWFELVSCPNYFGEVVEWLGWALMTRSWAGFGFFLYTCANLVPRARAHHMWYLEKFGEDYPKGRKAVIPFMY